MKTTQLTQFKKSFEQQKAAILLSQKSVAENFNVKPEELSDELDLASMELEQNMFMQLKSREVLFLKKIDQALGKINAGTFGVCECCEEEIEFSRLEVRPTADLCISCKETEENQEKRSAEGHSFKSMRIA